MEDEIIAMIDEVDMALREKIKECLRENSPDASGKAVSLREAREHLQQAITILLRK